MYLRTIPIQIIDRELNFSSTIFDNCSGPVDKLMINFSLVNDPTWLMSFRLLTEEMPSNGVPVLLLISSPNVNSDCHKKLEQAGSPTYFYGPRTFCH